jgi:quercetin 2,3-dioxygenase
MDDVQVVTSRDVPLGGPRAMTVRRTLPQRDRSLVGAWCFADHYGPDDVAGTGGMDVPPHPHTGLQTVSWLFTGEIEHRDTSGVHAFVRPGELNLMTGGHGVAHSEVSTPATPRSTASSSGWRCPTRLATYPAASSTTSRRRLR